MLGRIFPLVFIPAFLTVGPALPLLAQEAAPQDSAQQIIVRVDGASCPFCAFGLEKRLGRLDGVAQVRIEMKAGEAIVTVKRGAAVSEKALRQAVVEAGFTPREIMARTGPEGPR